MSPKRIQLSRKKGWRKPEGAIVVSRPSKWGNPYTMDEYRADYPDADDEELRFMATSDFRGLLEGQWGEEKGDYPLAAALRGHDLACWCPLDQPCHADVLLEVANSFPVSDMRPRSPPWAHFGRTLHTTTHHSLPLIESPETDVTPSQSANRAPG